VKTTNRRAAVRVQRLVRFFIVSIVFSLATTLSGAMAQPQPPGPHDRASTLLHGAAEALGGESALRAVSSIEIGGVSVWRQREQSERPEGPWVLTFYDFTDVRNFGADAIRRTTRTRGYSASDWVKNKDWDPESTLLIVNGVTFRKLKDRWQPSGTPWDAGTLPVALGPERVVLTALDAADARVEADAMLDGYAHHVIAFTHAEAKVRLFLNVPSLLPKAVEITRARPYDTYWAGWGDVTQRVTFGIWTLERGGLRVPRLWDFSTAGQSDGTIEITNVALNPAVVAADFAIPGDLQQSAIVNRRRVSDAPFGSSDRPAKELAPGIVHVPGSWDIVEIRQPDGAVILEGPLTSSYSAKVMEDERQRFSGAPIKAVVTTSDAWPHIGGMREYVARSIPIYALDLNVPILSRLFAATYTTSPDALARTPRPANLTPVSKRTMVGSGPNRFELIPYRTASGERQMMVYFPDHRLLYTSDLFTIHGPMIFLPEQVAEAVQAVARERLAVDRAFGMHYDDIPWQTVVDAAAAPGS